MTTIKIEENKFLFPDGEEYAIEKKLVSKLDRIIQGVTQNNPKEDALLINEGKEGWGKTNSAVLEALYIKIKTKRDVHLFFRIEELISFAQSNENKIIIWDEPSLDSLSTEQISKLNRNMLRLFMTARKKRHVFIVNYTKFWKFPEYIVVDRSIGMVHMSDKKIGRFQYIRRKKLELLWNLFRTKHKRAYRKCMEFGGRMPPIMEKYFDFMNFFVNGKANATYQDYEDAKDVAIGSIGKENEKKMDENLEKLNATEVLIGGLYVRKLFHGTQLDLATYFKMPRSTLRERIAKFKDVYKEVGE